MTVGTGSDAVLSEGESFDYYTLAEARSFLDDVSEPHRYSGEDIAAAHDATVGLFEDWCGVAFVPRTVTGHRERGEGEVELFLPFRKVTAVSNIAVDELDGDGPSAYTGTILVVEDSWIEGDEAFPDGSLVTLDVTHGFSSIPADVKRAALSYLRELMIGGSGKLGDTALPPRTQTYSVEGLTVDLSRTSEDNPTGIPFVDRVLNRYLMRVLSAEGV